MRPAALLLLAIASCGTMRAVKQGVERLGDDAQERQALTAEMRATNQMVATKLVPPLAETFGYVARIAGIAYLVLAGSVLAILHATTAGLKGLFGWHRKRKAKRAARATRTG